MIYVVGLHLAASSVAVAVITRRVDGSTIANVASFTSRAPAGAERIADLVALADRAICNPVLAAIAPVDGSPAGALRRAVLAALTGRGVEVVTVAPADVGTTDVAGLWPGVTPANAGEVAALQLAHHAAVRQGWVPAPRGVTPSGLGGRNAGKVDFAPYGSQGFRATAESEHQPRRDPAKSAPRIAEEDRLDPAELERQRQLATRRRVQPRVWR